MTDIIQTKKLLAEAWDILQDEKRTNNERRISYQDIIVLTNKIKETDKTFSLNETALKKYNAFSSKDNPTLNTNIKWVEILPGTPLEKRYNRYVGIALSIVTARCPNMPTDTDKFGTIVNATVSNLIALDSTPEHL